MTIKICSVRERRDRDLPDLAAALIRVNAQDGYPVEGVADPLGWLDHAHGIQSWTALVSDVPVGQVTLARADPEDDAAATWARHTGDSIDRLAIIVRLFVDPGQRNVGAGGKLVIAALNHARQIGRSVALDVMIKDRHAIRLYERLGGRQLGEIVHRHGQGLSEPAVVFDFPNGPPSLG